MMIQKPIHFRAGMGIEEALEVLKEYHEDIDAGLEPTGRNLGMLDFVGSISTADRAYRQQGNITKLG